MSATPVQPALFIDALNVAWWCGAPPQLRLPLCLFAALRAQGRDARLYFDANARHCLGDDAAIYQRLQRHPALCREAPSGQRADGLMLKQARDAGACIISRDHYHDYRRRFRRLIDDPGRRLPGHVKDERLVIAGLALDIPLAPSAAAAFEQLALPAPDATYAPMPLAGPMMNTPAAPTVVP